MACNVGGIERWVRIAIGILLVGLGAFGGLPAGLSVAAYVVGGVALVTGTVRYCPAWWLFGVNTCATKPAEKQ